MDVYLTESYENLKNESFEILDWWKINFSKYPIFSYVVRYILAMPVSIVTSESAFGTSGRILDPHQCSLSTRTMEALICTQNWLLSTPTNLDEAINKIEHIEIGNMKQLNFNCICWLLFDFILLILFFKIDIFLLQRFLELIRIYLMKLDSIWRDGKGKYLLNNNSLFVIYFNYVYFVQVKVRNTNWQQTFFFLVCHNFKL